MRLAQKSTKKSRILCLSHPVDFNTIAGKDGLELVGGEDCLGAIYADVLDAEGEGYRLVCGLSAFAEHVHKHTSISLCNSGCDFGLTIYTFAVRTKVPYIYL